MKLEKTRTRKNKEMEELCCLLFKKKQNSERLVEFLKTHYSPEEVEYLLYEIVVEYLYTDNLHQVMEQVQKKEIGWNHPNFSQISQDLQEEDDFIQNPPVVEEGVMECSKCHSKRTFSFSKQTRRSDESATVFVRCSNCNYTYKI
jgi:DNA-directed RNA polymerase subunit M/transcription elongation factor TFIIS